MHDNSTTKFKLTPRGEDLLASIDSLPDDPEPEVKTTTPCSKCNGLGEVPLFVSMETCDRCKGNKIEPASERPLFVHDEIVINVPLTGVLQNEIDKMHQHIFDVCALPNRFVQGLFTDMWRLL